MMRMVRIAALFVLLPFAAPSRAEAPTGAEGLKQGTPAPQFMLPVVNEFSGGTRWGPGKWTGPADPKTPPGQQKKLVIMSFFATYCEPCKQEMPELSRLYEAYKDQGLGVMLVSIDKGDEQRQQIVDLAQQNKVTFPVMHDRFQVVARRYAAERLPYMLMLDKSGTVANVHIGYTSEVKATLENEVRAGLGLPPLEAAPPPPSAAPTKKAKKGGT